MKKNPVLKKKKNNSFNIKSGFKRKSCEQKKYHKLLSDSEVWSTGVLITETNLFILFIVDI